MWQMLSGSVDGLEETCGAEVADLSGHGTWIDEALHEIIHGLVEVWLPLHTMSKGHEDRMATFKSAVLKTSQDRDSYVPERMRPLESPVASPESVARQ